MFGITSFHGFRYRTHILLYKIIGDLDATTWPEVFVGLLPPRLQPHSLRLATRITFKGFDTENQKPNMVLWDTPEGEFWGQLSDDWVLGLLIHEQVNLKIYQNDIVSVSEGDIVLDVGSHLGTFTRLALNRGAKLVVCFECVPTVLACFRKTFELEILEGRVVVVASAVWDTPGTLKFKQDRENTGGGYVGVGYLEVQAVTIDDVVAKLGLDRVDFIKMDIEGSERQALKGAEKTLASFAPKMAICIYHKKGDRRVIPELILGMQPVYQLRKSLNQAYFFK